MKDKMRGWVTGKVYLRRCGVVYLVQSEFTKNTSSRVFTGFLETWAEKKWSDCFGLRGYWHLRSNGSDVVSKAVNIPSPWWLDQRWNDDPRGAWLRNLIVRAGDEADNELRRNP